MSFFRDLRNRNRPTLGAVNATIFFTFDRFDQGLWRNFITIANQGQLAATHVKFWRITLILVNVRHG